MKINLKALVLSIFALLCMSVLQAQTHTVTGTITDQSDGYGIPGVNVIEMGTTTGTVTDLDGKFSLTVSDKNSKLQISFIGYKTIELEINERAIIDVQLTTDATELDELVVIGYGMQKKKVVTGAIASVKNEEILSSPILRAEQALQGRTPGVQVTSPSGQPGEGPTIRIRGAGTTGNADPMFVVDGMVVENIDFINPADIESMDVLKDAASAAIYGARAANGVVLITTKTGKAGKLNVKYSSYFGIQNPSNRLEMLNADQYMELMNEGAENANLTKPFDVNEIQPHNTDWQDEIFVKNAGITEHNLSITGGNENSSFASSLAYFSQNGVIGGDDSNFERITARLNSKHNVKDRITFGNNLTYSHINKSQIGSNESFNGVYSSALNLDPLTPVFEDDANNLNDPDLPYESEPVVTDANGRVYGISKYVPGEIVNPLALLETLTGKTKADRILGNTYAELTIIEGLKIKTSAGIDLNYWTDDSYRPLYYLNGAQYNVNKTSVSKSVNRAFTWQWENTLIYSKTIGEHNFSALLGLSSSETLKEDLYGYNTKVPTTDPDIINLNMATDTLWDAKGGASHYAIYSNFYRLTYDYKSRYAFTGIYRKDGSSRFGANKRYGSFWSFGATWLITEEPFMPDLGALNYLKLRASWGQNGNDRIGEYQFVSSIDKTRGYIFGGGREIGASPSYIENADIKWEASVQTNLAIDAGFFENKLTATIDYYIKTTEDLLEKVAIPAHVGNEPPYANIGSVQNKGVEIALNWREKKNEINYSVGVNASYNKNEVIKMETPLYGGSWAVAGNLTKTEEGMPIAYFYGYETDGIFQSEAEIFQHIGKTGQVLQPNAVPGDVRFVDVNNDGKISKEDRTMIGNPTPDFTLGVNGSVEYRNFDMSFLLTGAFGHDIFNGTQRQDLSYTNRTTAMLDRWTGPGTSNEIPRYTWDDVNENYRISDLYIEDGSYLRVKNIQFGYEMPTAILNKYGIDKWRWYISAENLFTFTKYTGVDPEIGAKASLDIGIDRGVYPQARTFRIGTAVSF